MLVAALCVALLAACARTDDSPRPTHTQTAELTTSSNGAKPAKREACKLLTSEERKGLAGRTMDSVVPVSAAAGTQECQWVHSLQDPSNAVIRLVAINTQEWAKVARTQINEAIRNPRLSANTVMRLQAASKRLAKGTSDLTDNQVCNIYWTLAAASGFHHGAEVVFSSTIGRMHAAYAASCGEGWLTMIGYGEYGLHTSITLYQALIDLRGVVQDRAAKLTADKDSPGPSSSASPSAGASASASPTPSATGSADADSSR